jgi:aldehyde dehydrogenase (NAD(P)+)
MIPATPTSVLDTDLARLHETRTTWARLPLRDKTALLARLRPRVDRAAEGWVRAAAHAKGLAPGSPLVGEEWISGPWALLNGLNALEATLGAVARGRTASLVDGRTHTRADGTLVADVFPATAYDRLLLNGYTAEVWMQPGVTAATLPDTMATFYRQRDPEGGVAVVLGAGNIASIAPLDVIYELYAKGHVALLKLNPVNEYLGPVFETVFAEFIEAGYLAVAYGGADVGEALTRHAMVDAIHVTGSAATHDAIVYGTGAEGARRKAADEPAIDTPVSSELGGVTPVVVVPGDWSEPDLAFQAEHVATMKMHNGGFNCIGAQVLVLPEAWPQRDAFLAELRRALAALPDRPAYYPGADDRLRDALTAHPDDAEAFSGRLLLHADSQNADDPGFTDEIFGPALVVTTLPGDTAEAFLTRAVDFCNGTLAGTLGMTILAHPSTIADLGERFETEIARLRYGTVGVNVWSGAGFLLPQGAWGAAPGHTRTDIQSGVGIVHNALLFDKPQKTVVRGPFAPFPRTVAAGRPHLSPKPPWFVTNATAATTGERLTRFAAAPSPLKLPGIFASALRG